MSRSKGKRGTTTKQKAQHKGLKKAAARRKETDEMSQEAQESVEQAEAEIAASGEAIEPEIEPHAGKKKAGKAGLFEIAVRKAWNSRHFFGEIGEDEESLPDDAAIMGGFDEKTGKPTGGLIGGIFLKGQNTPLDVRPNTKAGGNEPHELVCGERRLRAMKALHEHGFTWPGGGTLEAPTVNVTIWEDMTDAEADDLNAIENTQREHLPAADLAFAVARMKKNGEGRTDTAIAKLVGKKQSYVSKLIRIMTKVKPAITRAWRASPSDISYKELLPLVDLDKSEQEDAWARIISRHSDTDEEGKAGSSRANKWVETASAKAAEFARVLGTFAAYGLTKPDDILAALGGEEGWLEVLVKVRKDATKRERTKIVKAAADAFVSAQTKAVEDAQAQKDDEEAA